MKIIRSRIIDRIIGKEVDSIDAYMVTWKSRKGQFSCDTKDEVRVFVNKEDAESFANSLKEATRLLRHSEGISLHIKRCEQL